MAQFTSGIWLYLTIALLAVIFAAFLRRRRKMTRKELGILAVFLVIGIALFAIENVNAWIIGALEIGMLSFNGLLSGKSPKNRTAYVALSLLYVALVHYVGFRLIAQALLIGILSGITNIRQYKNRIMNRRVEIERDLVHLCMGVILMAIFYFEPEPIAVTALIMLVIGGIAAISLAEIYRGGKISSIVYKFERNGASLGHGAMWLALGALVAVAFLKNYYIIAVFSALFIGDPAATISGLYLGGPRLPYNHDKSVSGTIAFFAVTALVSYYFIGWYAIVVGIVAALVESLKLKIDDNFTVSAALVILLTFFG